jgi:hypothetical protein
MGAWVVCERNPRARDQLATTKNRSNTTNTGSMDDMGERPPKVSRKSRFRVETHLGPTQLHLFVRGESGKYYQLGHIIYVVRSPHTMLTRT